MRKNYRSIFLDSLQKAWGLQFVFLLFSCHLDKGSENTLASSMHLDFGKYTDLSTLRDLHSQDTLSLLDHTWYTLSGDSMRDVEISLTSPYSHTSFRCVLLGFPSQGCKMAFSLTPEDQMRIQLEYQENTIDSVFVLQKEQAVIHFYREELFLIENGPTSEVLSYAMPRCTDIALFGAICGWNLQEDTAVQMLNILTEKSFWYTQDQGVLSSTEYFDLHFWATWCGPCLAEFKRMDSSFFDSENRLFIALEYNRKAPQSICSMYSMKHAVQIYPFLLSDYSIDFLPTDVRYFPSTRTLWYRE